MTRPSVPGSERTVVQSGAQRASEGAENSTGKGFGGLAHDLDWTGLLGSAASLADPGERAMRGAEEDVLVDFEPLPPSRLLAAARNYARARIVRDEVFGHGQFLDPSWNVLIELFIAGEEGRNVTIKSACVAACVPQSTALRHIAHLIDIRLATRAQHPSDARSAYLKLTDRGRAKMVAFLSLSAADRP